MTSIVAARRGWLVAGLALSAACGSRPQDDSPRPATTSAQTVTQTASAAPRPEINPRIARAEAYVFNETSGSFCPLVLGPDGRLCPSARPAKKPLSREQMERAIALFTEPEFSPMTAPWCFEPHHGIVFYDAQNAPVSAITVCFECERQAGWPQSVASGMPEKMPHASPAALAAYRNLFCGDLGLPRCVPGSE